jgi:hypothetical protein
MLHHDLNKMILQTPVQCDWLYEDGSPGGFSERPVFDFPEDLPLKWKVLACVIAYNKAEICPFYRTLERNLGITRKEAQKAVRELRAEGRLSTMPTMSESTGLLCGSGFYAN